MSWHTGEWREPMQKACVICGQPSEQARCPRHRYTRKRGAVARRQRMRVIERDEYICRRCGVWLTPRTAHVDHIIPLRDGGSEAMENKQLLCQACNLQKG